MSAALRKGWCPGALRPMTAKDGLLVRLRITGGILPAAKAQAIAGLATRCGNGLFDLSARGNLQLRGIDESALGELQDGLATLGLLDQDAAGESVRNVIASPLAGLHGGIDIRPLTKALEKRLVSDTALHGLPAKFGFLIDDGSAPSLAGIAADVRFDWLAARQHFLIGLGGTRDDAIRIGHCRADRLAATAAKIARAALSLFEADPDARRMRDLVDRGDEGDMVARLARAVDRSDAPSAVLRMVPLPRFAEDDRGAGAYPALYAPFGRLDAAMLRAAADLAADSPHGEMRLTPWRAILVPGAAHQALPGFIGRDDPGRRIAACVGVDGCERGTTSTQTDAARLATSLDGSTSDEIELHVSGCAKGCAKASPTRLTLVAREGRYDLVRNGRAGDPPVACGLDFDGARAAILSERTPT